jgi:hypothetical protein
MRCAMAEADRPGTRWSVADPGTISLNAEAPPHTSIVGVSDLWHWPETPFWEIGPVMSRPRQLAV